jgi:hypothetical protein
MEKRIIVAAQAQRLRPVDWHRRLLVAGLVLALVVAGVVAALDTFRVSRQCGGAFSRAFNAGFDRYKCELVIRSLKGDRQNKLPLPMWS